MDRVRHAVRAARRRWPAALGAGAIATIGFSFPVAAQSVADVQRELTEMRRHYDAELKRLQRDYDARIRRLEAQLKASEIKPVAEAGSAATALLEPVPAQVTVPPPSAPEVTVSEAAPAQSAAPPGITIGMPPRGAVAGWCGNRGSGRKPVCVARLLQPGDRGHPARRRAPSAKTRTHIGCWVSRSAMKPAYPADAACRWTKPS